MRLLGTSLSLLALCLPLGAQTLYVNTGASGANDGSSWHDAYLELRDALAAAPIGGTQIWVAQGTYTPAWAAWRKPRVPASTTDPA